MLMQYAPCPHTLLHSASPLPSHPASPLPPHPASPLLHPCLHTLLQPCITPASTLHHPCFNPASPLLHPCFTPASPLRHACLHELPMFALHHCSELRQHLQLLRGQSGVRDSVIQQWLCMQRPFKSEAPLLMEIFQQVFKGATASDLAKAAAPAAPPQQPGQSRRAIVRPKGDRRSA